MPKKKKKTADISKLRQRAEEALKAVSVDNDNPVMFSLDEMNSLIHELEVHQIELEMQNDELRSSQLELETERTRYFEFYNMAPVGFFSVNVQNLILECNLTASKLLGIPLSRLINQPITRFILKEDQDIYYLHNKQLFGIDARQGCDLRFLKNDGSVLWVHLETTIVHNTEGATEIRMVISDITIRKKTEDELKQNEQRYKKAQRLGQVGNWEYDIRTKKIWGSDETKRIYGLKPENIDFTTDEVGQCIPDKKLVRQALVDLIEKGKPYNIEYEIRPATGADKRTIKSIAKIVKDESGKSTKIAGVIHDITVQRLADEELRKSEGKYRHLFSSISDYILLVDTDKNIIDCNQAFNYGFGYTQEEIIGIKTICLYASKKEYQEMKKEFKKHLDDSRFTYTIHYKKKSGEVFPGEISVFNLRNDKEEIVGFIGIIRDITYRKMVEESLRRANEELNQKTDALEDMNTALKILLQKREQDNQELEENIYSNYELMLTPFLNKLKNSASNDNQEKLIEIIDTNLKEIVSPFTKILSNPMLKLTPAEMQISTMIKQGLSNKEIAQTLTCSKRTVDSHRENIRKKLNLKNKKINLKTFLINPQNT